MADSALIANTTLLLEDKGRSGVPDLTWVNVAIASSFILVNGLIQQKKRGGGGGIIFLTLFFYRCYFCCVRLKA